MIWLAAFWLLLMAVYRPRTNHTPEPFGLDDL